jgi:hypothetical protein
MPSFKHTLASPSLTLARGAAAVASYRCFHCQACRAQAAIAGQESGTGKQSAEQIREEGAGGEAGAQVGADGGSGGGVDGMASPATTGSPTSPSRHSAHEEGSDAAAEQQSERNAAIGRDRIGVQHHTSSTMGVLLAVRVLAMFRCKYSHGPASATSADAFVSRHPCVCVERALREFSGHALDVCCSTHDDSMPALQGPSHYLKQSRSNHAPAARHGLDLRRDP